MPKVRPKPAPPSGLTPTEKVELRALLGKVPPIDPEPVRDIGPEAPPALVGALEYVLGRGIRTSERLRAYEARGGWLIDSRILEDLQRVAA